MEKEAKTAWVFQINVSDGGLPKRPLPRAEVSAAGVSGDRQADLRYHGGPDRALVLFGLERILALQKEGHPIYPGSIGENITLAGLDWSGLQPGQRLRLGTLEIELTDYATPCSKIGGSFSKQRFDRVAQKRHPGWSRLCARVLVGGTVQPGDQVSLLP
jgi:MOSC domain-containing protein YiiM